MGFFGDVWTGLTDPGKPQREAGNKLQALGQKAIDYSGTQWDRQMQGLGSAQGAWNPATSALADYKSYAGNAGPMQQAYDTYGQNYMQPSATQGLYQNTQRQYNLSPTNAQGAYSGLSGQLGANNSAQQYSSMYQGPSNQQTAYNASAGSLMGPSQASQAYQTQYGPQFANAGQGENYASRNGGYFAQPGMLEGAAGGLGAQAQGSSDPSKLAFQTAGSQFTNAGWLTDQAVQRNRDMGNQLQADLAKHEAGFDNRQGELSKLSPEIGGAFRNANDVQGFSQRNGGQLEQQGMGEQFAQRYLDETNPYNERMQKKLTDSMNQQLAARGLYAGGGAVAGIGNALGEFQAQNYKNMADVSARGQEMQMSRLKQGQGLAESASGEKQMLGKNLQGLGTGLEGEWAQKEGLKIADRDSLSRNAQGLMAMNLQGASQGENARLQGAQGYMNAASQAGGADLAAAQGAAGIYGAGQGAGLSRVMGGGQLAQNAQGLQLQRMQGGMQAAQGVDQAGLSRTLGLGTMAGGADAGRNALTALGLQGAGQADQTALSRAGLGVSAAQGADAASLGRQQLLAGMAGQTDATRLNSLNSMFSQANQLNQLQNSQQAQMLAAQLGISQAEAGQILQAYATGGQLAGQQFDTGLNAMATGIGQVAQGQATNQGWARGLVGAGIGGALGGPAGAQMGMSLMGGGSMGGGGMPQMGMLPMGATALPGGGYAMPVQGPAYGSVAYGPGSSGIQPWA